MSAFKEDLVVRDSTGEAADTLRSSLSVDRGTGVVSDKLLREEQQSERANEEVKDSAPARDASGRFVSKGGA